MSNLKVLNYPYFEEKSELITLRLVQIFNNQENLNFDFDKLPHLKDIYMFNPNQNKKRIDPETILCLKDLRRIDLYNFQFNETQQYKDLKKSLARRYRYEYEHYYSHIYRYYELFYYKGKPHQKHPKTYE